MNKERPQLLDFQVNSSIMKETYMEFLGTYIKGIIWAPVMYGHFNLHTYDTQELIQEMKKKE